MDDGADSRGSNLVGHQVTVELSRFETNGGLRGRAFAAPVGSPPPHRLLATVLFTDLVDHGVARHGIPSR